MVHFLLDQSHSNLDLAWANDCAINQENCAISSDNFVIPYLLFLVRNQYLEPSIFGKSDSIIDLSTLLLALLKVTWLYNYQIWK